MKYLITFTVLSVAALADASGAAIAWSAGQNNGFSLVNDSSDVPAGSLIRLGVFRDSATGAALTMTEIQSLAANPNNLNSRFVELDTATIGQGVGGISGHFTDNASNVNTDTVGGAFSVVGFQMYMWVFNAPSLAAATQQGIFSFDIANTTSNPDTTPTTPGVRWRVPTQNPVAGSTSIDLTDLTNSGQSALAPGAQVIVGTFPTGTSNATSSPNFGLVTVVPEPSTALLVALGGIALSARRRRAA